MIELTTTAAACLRLFMEQEQAPPEFVRFGIKAGGCSGFTYTIDFTNTKHPAHDLLYHTQGVDLLVDKKSHLYVAGTTIDWSDDLNNKGFLFDNPAAKSSCGCKTSFMIDIESAVPTALSSSTPTWMT